MGNLDHLTVILLMAGVVTLVVTLAYQYWRQVWFFRDPPRAAPAQHGLVSAADGIVVYVRRVAAGGEVLTIKRGLAARLADIVHADLDTPKLVIGVFMSPFDVHYNRAPLDGIVESITAHPGRSNVHMGPMHWRSVFGVTPRYQNSEHIVRNERTVTRLGCSYRGQPLSLYIVQIGAKTVNGIESYFKVGEPVRRGEKFGMIRIGSQVDLVIPARADLEVLVSPGDRVKAGETILVR